MKPDKPSNKERLEHILTAIQLIQSFSEGHTSESFAKDYKAYYACLFQYTIIGEATTYIDSEILMKYDYPWYKVKSFRNFILHDYHSIDERVVWDTTRKILPDLEEIIRKILEKEYQ